jgi:hypothetical protein
MLGTYEVLSKEIEDPGRKRDRPIPSPSPTAKSK